MRTVAVILIGLGALLLGGQAVALVKNGEASSVHVIAGLIMVVGGLVIVAVTKQKQQT